MAEYLERDVAMTMPVLPKRYRQFQTDNLDDAYEQGWMDALDNLKNSSAVDVEKISDGYHRPKPKFWSPVIETDTVLSVLQFTRTAQS